MSKKDEVLGTALKLFSVNGYSSIGVDRIIKDSGVARMTVYNRFGSKDGLIEEVLKLRDSQFMESLRGYVKTHGTGPLEKITAVFQWHRNWFSEPDYHGCLFIKASEEFGDGIPAFSDIVKQHKMAIVELLIEILRPGYGKKAEQKGIFLFILLEGLIVYSNMFKKLDYFDTVVSSLEGLLAM